MKSAPAISAVLVGLLAAGTLPAGAEPVAASRKPIPATKDSLTQRERAMHAVSRLTFGATPGLVEQVQREGVDAWIDQQLKPSSINDQNLQAMLEELPAMQLAQQQLFHKFPPNSMLRPMARGNAPLAIPSDPAEAAIYQNQLAYLRDREGKKKAEQQSAQVANVSANVPAANGKMQSMQSAQATQNAAQNQQQNAPEDQLTDSDKQRIKAEQAELLAIPQPEARYQKLLAMTPGEPRRVIARLSPAQRQKLAEGMQPAQKEVVAALAAPTAIVAGEEMEQKLLYDVYSQRQLLEVMTDFWLNHFNVYVRKNEYAPWVIATYERDVIRPHAMGKFEDLLRATAESPAMMEYLDNFQSIGPDSQAVARAKARQQQGQQGNFQTPLATKLADRGLNENYARELMELHTLGVDGGYTQKDVTEVAKVFTGWTVDKPGQGGEFQFDARRHQPGTKTVLGKSIHEDGQQEGLEVLHMLATSPATARHLSRQLAVKFVSDNPPPALVDRMSATYLKTGGNISEVLRTMFHSPEFWSRDAYRAKVKTPLEFVVSSVRATGTDASHPGSLIQAMNKLGMPLYGQQPPTGYSNENDAWVSSAALIGRMNFALALAANKLPQLPCDPQALAGTQPDAPAAAVEQRLEATLLNDAASDKTRQTVVREMADLSKQEEVSTQAARQFAPEGAQRMASDPIFNPVRRKNDNVSTGPAYTPQGQVTEAAVAAGLLLGSPEFQRR